MARIFAGNTFVASVSIGEIYRLIGEVYTLGEQIFFSKLFELIGKFVTFIVFAVACALSLLLYVVYPQTGIFYLLFIIFLAWTPIFGIKAYVEYSRIMSSLNNVKVGPLNLRNFHQPGLNDIPVFADIPEDRALSACVAYHNGSSFTDIKVNFGLYHPEEARRLVIKGIDILLKEHREKKQHDYMV